MGDRSMDGGEGRAARLSDRPSVDELVHDAWAVTHTLMPSAVNCRLRGLDIHNLRSVRRLARFMSHRKDCAMARRFLTWAAIVGAGLLPIGLIVTGALLARR